MSDFVLNIPLLERKMINIIICMIILTILIMVSVSTLTSCSPSTATSRGKEGSWQCPAVSIQGDSFTSVLLPPTTRFPLFFMPHSLLQILWSCVVVAAVVVVSSLLLTFLSDLSLSSLRQIIGSSPSPTQYR